MAYSDKVIDHLESPRNVGSLDRNDPDVGTGMVGAPACGDVMKLQLKINSRSTTAALSKMQNSRPLDAALQSLPVP